jgi:uncharacterized membrane protein YkoI
LLSYNGYKKRDFYQQHRDREASHRINLRPMRSKISVMKTTKLLAVAMISAGLSLGMTAQAKEKKHEEQTINSSDVPAAVQTAGENEAKGGKILRWEKEGDNFEAVVKKNGKEWGVKIDPNGKVLSKHNEKTETGEKY